MTQEWSLLTPLGIDLGVVDFKFLHMVLVEASESRFWTHSSRFLASGRRFWASIRVCAVGVAYGPLRVNFGHLAVSFWTSGSRIWAFESQFRASGSSFLLFGRRIWALLVKLNRPLGVDFTCLEVELEKQGVLTVQLVLNTLPPG